jgi:hypothetical protein
METVGGRLRRIDVGGWQGKAFDAFQWRFSEEPPKWLRAGDAMNATADALVSHADTLRWAQGQAGYAIQLWRMSLRAARSSMRLSVCI